MAYRILTARSIHALELLVNNLTADNSGWEPQGGVGVSPKEVTPAHKSGASYDEARVFYFFQAMYKPDRGEVSGG